MRAADLFAPVPVETPPDEKTPCPYCHRMILDRNLATHEGQCKKNPVNAEKPREGITVTDWELQALSIFLILQDWKPFQPGGAWKKMGAKIRMLVQAKTNGDDRVQP
jgi:hypothetical protein